MVNELRYVKTRNVKDPHRGTPHSAGLDLFVPDDLKIFELLDKNETVMNRIETDVPDSNRVQAILLHPGEGILIPTGLHFNIPEGYMLHISNKSGIASKYGLLCGACVCDQDYCGIVHLNVWNVSDKNRRIQSGMKLAQAILIPVEYPTLRRIETVDELYSDKQSERGENGFGSTGIK